MAQTRIGISGWIYPPWRGVFYPKGLPQKQELAYASRQVRTIEINGSFYSLQRPESYQRWYSETPEDFVFSVKGNRFITHLRRLREIDAPLANFFASGVLALREKLGPILWQFPPTMKFDPGLFREFLELLPHDTLAASRLAKHHDTWLEGRSVVHPGGRRAVRHSIEIRHPSFMVPDFFKLLRKHHVAWVIADSAGKWPYREEVTSDFVYVRLHGAEELYVSGYDAKTLDSWARKIRRWEALRKDVFVYFDNDVKVRAPADARSLAERLERRRRAAA